VDNEFSNRKQFSSLMHPLFFSQSPTPTPPPPHMHFLPHFQSLVYHSHCSTHLAFSVVLSVTVLYCGAAAIRKKHGSSSAISKKKVHQLKSQCEIRHYTLQAKR
jgi:hypothetical protein